jgi:FkbM family methyltransferase
MLFLYRNLRKHVRKLLLRFPLVRFALSGLAAQADALFLRWRIPRQETFIQLCVHGHSLTYSAADLRHAPQILLDEYEPESTKFLQSFLREGMLFVDVGAHVGIYTLVAASAVRPSGQVISFEPNPRVREMLTNNVAKNHFERMVTIVPAAVSNQKRSRLLYLGQSDSGRTSLYPTPGESIEAIEVEATTLDAFFQSVGWPSIHLIKMDIEGEERFALDGMKEVSLRNPMLKLIIEFNPIAMRASGTNPGSYFEAIQRCGFTRVSLLGPEFVHLRIPEDVSWLTRMARWIPVNLLCEKLNGQESTAEPLLE